MSASSKNLGTHAATDIFFILDDLTLHAKRVARIRNNLIRNVCSLVGVVLLVMSKEDDFIVWFTN